MAVPSVPAVPLVARVRRGLREWSNWVQLVKFSVVGGSGYLVNLIVFSLLFGQGLHYGGAAVGAFLVAVTNNYMLNRLWTFRDAKGHVAYQGARFLVLATVVLGSNLLLLTTLVAMGIDELAAQAIAVAFGMPLNFAGNKLWTFDRHRLGPRS